MYEILIQIIILIVSFYLLIKSSDYLVSSSSIIGSRFGISKFIIGLTLVAIGTSLPELFTSITALFTSNEGSSFIFGTVLGSNISNILLIFGFLIFFSNNFKSELEKHNKYFIYLSLLFLLIIIYFKEINLIISLLLLTSFIFYIYHNVIHSKKKDLLKEVEEFESEEDKKYSTKFLFFIFLLSLIFLNLSSRGVVYAIENLGLIFNIPVIYLTLTTVAFATSLPELVVTYSSAKKSEFDIAIGNILGSNLSNIFLIFGVSGVFSFFMSKEILINLTTALPSIIILFLSSIIFILLANSKKVKKFHGAILIIFYLLYISFIFI